MNENAIVEELYEAIEVVKTNVENVCLRGIE